jgi:hypothetical protein
MSPEMKQMLAAALIEMCANLQRSGVTRPKLRAAVMNTAGNLFGNDYDEIVELVLDTLDSRRTR